MAAPKRTEIERDYDLRQTASLYLQGLTQQEIAQRLGVCRQQITYDLNTLHQRWQNASTAEIAKWKAKELARIDHLERVAWEAWEQSRQDAETSHVKVTKSGEGPEQTVSERTTKGQTGDPRLLERVAWCIDQRCRIIGLLAPTKVAPTSPNGEEPYAGGITPAAIAEARERLHRRMAGPPGGFASACGEDGHA